MKLSALRASEFFTQSKTQYPPGYEFESIEENPQFRVMNPDGSPQPLDDLRLKPDSPARTAGVLLPPDLQPLDDAAGEAVMLPPSRDIGCYRFGSRPLRVGVNGRRRFPIAGTIP